MATVNIERLFARFCTEHQLYAVASFAHSPNTDTIQCESECMGNALHAPVRAMTALAQGCDEQVMRLHKFEEQCSEESGYGSPDFFGTQD